MIHDQPVDVPNHIEIEENQDESPSLPKVVPNQTNNTLLWDETGTNLDSEVVFIELSYEEKLESDSGIFGNILDGRSNFQQVWVDEETLDEGEKIFYSKVKT